MLRQWNHFLKIKLWLIVLSISRTMKMRNTVQFPMRKLSKSWRAIAKKRICTWCVREPTPAFQSQSNSIYIYSNELKRTICVFFLWMSWFVCSYPLFLFRTFLCDGDDDCGDYSDETHCGARVNCSMDQFECGNGLCIQKKWICDGDNDCHDYSDEVNCTKLS